MNEYKRFIGMVIDNNMIDGVVKYFDLSLEKMTYAFELTPVKSVGKGYAISCELFVEKYIK